MQYKFQCTKCRKTFYSEIAISDYSELKDKQKCPKCDSPSKRVIEWEGIATGSGSGWCGKSDGNAI